MKETENLKASVLLVDDEKQFLEVLSERLKNRGLSVNSVTSGEDAISLANNKDYDVIVLDLAMPGIDGLQTLNLLKKNNHDMEIIILTGHATVKKGIEAMKLGAEDFLEKPVDLDVLLEKIGEAKQKKTLIMEKKVQKELKHILKSKSW